MLCYPISKPREGAVHYSLYTPLIMRTVSKRLAEKKVAKFEKNITRRGVGSVSSNKEFEPALILLILFAVLVIASFIFQVVRMAISGGGVPQEN